MNYADPITPSEVCAEAERLIAAQIAAQERIVRQAEATILGLGSALDTVRSMGDAFKRHQPVVDPFD